MPSSKTHLDKVQANYDFLKFINKDHWVKKNYPDWYITVMFYISVHVMQAYLAKSNKHPTDHVTLECDLGATLGTNNITITSHKDLSRLSRIGRYLSNPGSITATQILGQDLKDAEEDFEEIKRFCKAELALELK
jgi:hypothetical protein